MNNLEDLEETCISEIFSYSNIIKFDCNGNWRREGLYFNPNGFYMSYDLIMKDTVKNRNEIILFGKNFDFFSVLQSNCAWLFNMSRKVLLELRDLEIDVPKPYEKQISKEGMVLSMNKIALDLRSSITRFLYYIDYYLGVCVNNTDKCNLLISDIMNLESELDNLKILVHHLNKYFLSEQFLLQCTLLDENMLPNPSYQLIHCCLDFQWFYILIKYKLNDLKNLLHCNPSETMALNMSDTFLLLMSELMFTSIIKYKWKEINNLNEDMLICPCIREIWVLLFRHLGLEAFWDYFNQVLHTILEMKCPQENEILKKLCASSYYQFKFVNEKEFALHFLNEMAKLKSYIIYKTDYPLNADCFIPFYDSVKQYLDSDPNEKSLRIILRIVASIMDQWQLEKEHVIVLLWEYFYKRLHSTFQIPGIKYVSSENQISGSSFLKEVKNRFLPLVQPNESENSFSLFLRIFANHVQKSRMEGFIMKNLYSNIYIKFDVLKKFEKYGEIALYHTSSLFLTAAIAYGVEKEVKKLRDLMMARKSEKLTAGEKTVKWKSLIACLLLLAENGYSVKEITEDLINEVRNTLHDKDVSHIPIFVECLQNFIANRDDYMSGLSIIGRLTEDWILKYMSICPVCDRGQFLSIYDPLIEELRQGAEWWSREEAEDIEKQLCSYVLPAVKLNVDPSVARTAAHFLSFFIKTKQWGQVYSLCSAWMHSKDVTGYVTTKFVIAFYELEGDISKLSLFNPDYDTDILQSLISYHLLSEQARIPQCFSRIVNSLPSLSRHAQNVDWVKEGDDLVGFIRLFGVLINKSSSPKEKSSLKELFNKYFSKLGHWIKIGLTSIKSKTVIHNIYRCSAFIVAECYSVIHEENNSFCILSTIIDSVLLPVGKYKNYNQLPPTFAEAVTEYLPLFIRGLMKLDRRESSDIKRTVTDVIEFYFPGDPYFAEGFFKSHPFYKCLTDIEIASPFSVLLENVFGNTYKLDDHRWENCIRLFSFISCPFSRDIIFANSIYSIVNKIMKTDGSFSMSKCCLDYINRCIKDSNDCRSALIKTLEKIVSSELLICSEGLGNILKQLLNAFSLEVSGMIIIVERELEKAKHAKDENRLSYLRRIEHDLKSSTIKQGSGFK